MATRSEQKQAQGPIQIVEEIWGKIFNDSRVRDALDKTRKFISNGPFIAIVIGAGGESKPVTFAVLPLIGLTQAGRVAQAIEEATSGNPLTINTVLTTLQSLGAISVPGMVVGTIVSGGVNTVKLLVNEQLFKRDPVRLENNTQGGSTSQETQVVVIDQGPVGEEGIGKRGYWYRIINGNIRSLFKAKL